MKIIDGDLVGLVSTELEDGAIVEKRKFIFRLRLEDGTFVDVPAINTGREQKKKVDNQTKKFKKIKKEVEEVPDEDIDDDIDEEDVEEVPDVDEEVGDYI